MLNGLLGIEVTYHGDRPWWRRRWSWQHEAANGDVLYGWSWWRWLAQGDAYDSWRDQRRTWWCCAGPTLRRRVPAPDGPGGGHVMRRLIVAGTRHAKETHLPMIGETLIRICRQDLGVLIHGDGDGSGREEVGVDRLAARLAETWGWQVRPVPARWQVCDTSLPRELGGCPSRPHRRWRRDGTWYCPFAGPRRNQQVVDLGCRGFTSEQDTAAEVVVFPAAGPRSRSRGTWDLYARAKAAGLRVHEPVPLEVG